MLRKSLFAIAATLMTVSTFSGTIALLEGGASYAAAA